MKRWFRRSVVQRMSGTDSRSGNAHNNEILESRPRRHTCTVTMKPIWRIGWIHWQSTYQERWPLSKVEDELISHSLMPNYQFTTPPPPPPHRSKHGASEASYRKGAQTGFIYNYVLHCVEMKRERCCFLMVMMAPCGHRQPSRWGRSLATMRWCHGNSSSFRMQYGNRWKSQRVRAIQKPREARSSVLPINLSYCLSSLSIRWEGKF